MVDVRDDRDRAGQVGRCGHPRSLSGINERADSSRPRPVGAVPAPKLVVNEFSIRAVDESITLSAKDHYHPDRWIVRRAGEISGAGRLTRVVLGPVRSVPGPSLVADQGDDHPALGVVRAGGRSSDRLVGRMLFVPIATAPRPGDDSAGGTVYGHENGGALRRVVGDEGRYARRRRVRRAKVYPGGTVPRKGGGSRKQQQGT